MKHGIITSILIAAGLLPVIATAQSVDLNFSNNSKYAYSIAGDTGECLLNITPFSIKTLSWKDASRLCKGEDCKVSIYASVGCKGSAEGSFTWINSYGAITPTSQFSFIIIQVSRNTVFITDRHALPSQKAETKTSLAR